MYAFLHELFEVKRMGGRVRSVGRNEFVVMDVAFYSHSMWTELHARFPLAQVDIEACTNSLGGFAVRVRTVSSSVRPYVMTSVFTSVLLALWLFTLDSVPDRLRFLFG